MTQSMRALVVLVLMAGAALAQGVQGVHRLTVVDASISSSISIVTAKTDLTFEHPYPGNGMDPDYTGSVLSAESYETDPPRGVAHLAVDSNNVMLWTWAMGTNLQSGSNQLPTSFQFRYKGYWEMGGKTSGKTLRYYPGAGSSPPVYGLSGMVPANWTMTDFSGPGPTRVPLTVIDPRVELWIRAQVTRNGRSDAPGVYAQGARQLMVTFTVVP